MRRISPLDSVALGAMMTPAILIMVVFIFGFLFWTVFISFTDSSLLPSYDFVGWLNYGTVFSSRRWGISVANLMIFSPLYIGSCMFIGLMLAIFIDQNVAGENVFRSIYLYPMAISFVVTGTVWRWILSPSTGLQTAMQSLGFTNFEFGWIGDRDMAIYTAVIAGAWHTSGFAMALFLAGLRGVNREQIHAAQIDGASTFRIYTKILLPSIKVVFVAVFFVLAQSALKTYDLVVALTGGGPGIASDLPAIFVRDVMFNRGRIGEGAVGAVVMFVIVIVLMALGHFINRYQQRDLESDAR